jgi:fluoride exporter
MIKELLGFILVFFGGGIGVILRHLINRLATLNLQSTFPWHTLFINVLGSLIMGLVVGWFAFRSQGGSEDFRLFLTTGVIGGFTTFSTFSLDVVTLWERGDILSAFGYSVMSVVCSVSILFVGLWLVRISG